MKKYLFMIVIFISLYCVVGTTSVLASSEGELGTIPVSGTLGEDAPLPAEKPAIVHPNKPVITQLKTPSKQTLPQLGSFKNMGWIIGLLILVFMMISSQSRFIKKKCK